VSRGRSSPLRRGLRRLTDPEVVGWPLFWWSLGVWLLSFYPAILRADYPFTWALVIGWAVSILVGQAVLFAFLLVARRLWWRRAWMLRHPAAAVWSFVIGSLLAVVAASVTASMLPAGEQGLVFGLEYFTFSVISLCLFGSLVVTFRQYRRDVTKLRLRQVQLAQTMAIGRETLESERQDTEDLVQEAMADALAVLEVGPSDAIDALNVASEEVLRPLSHSLAEKNAGIEPPVVMAQRPRWSTILSEVTRAPLIAPFTTAVIMLILALRITFEDADGATPSEDLVATGGAVSVSVDVSSLVAALLELASVFVGTWVAALLVAVISRRLLLRGFSTQRWLVVLTSSVIVGVLSWAFISLLFTLLELQVRAVLDGWTVLLLIAVMTLVSLIMGVTRAIAIAGRDVRHQLDEANHALEWQIARTNQLIWDQRRALALIVHGPMRAALISSAMQLSKVTDASTDDVWRVLRERIEKARAGSFDDSEAQDLPRSLQGLQKLWEGTCSISLVLDPSTMARLEVDSVAARTCDRIAAEACSNAIVHGGATSVEVTVVAADGQLLIDVGNDGRPPEAASRRGLGSGFLDEVCLDWSLATEGEITRLRCTIPLA